VNKFVVMEKDINMPVMMVIQSMVMVAVINVKFKMDGVVLVEVRHQKVFVPNLFQPEVL